MFCSKCGRNIVEGSSFCSGCGSPVRAVVKTGEYLQPGVNAPMAPVRTYNTLSIVSLVTGLINMWMFLLILFPLPLVTGIIALVQISRAEDTQKGKGMAIWGVVLGGLGLLVYGGIIGAWIYYELVYGEVSI